MKEKLLIIFAAVFLFAPASTWAFSFDDVVKDWMASMRQKVAVLEKENASLKSQLATCKSGVSKDSSTKSVKSGDANADAARKMLARWNTIETAIAVGKYNRGSISGVNGCKTVDGCPITPFPTELATLIKRMLNDGSLARAGYRMSYVPKHLSLDSKVIAAIVGEIDIEQSKLKEELL